MKHSILASIFYISVVISVVLPMWYYTTTPLRFSLPDLSSLQQPLIIDHIDVTVIKFIDIDKQTLESGLRRKFRSQMNGNPIEIDWTIRPPLTKEEKIFNESKNLLDFDSKLVDLEQLHIPGRLLVLLVSDDWIKPHPNTNLTIRSNHRCLYVGVDVNNVHKLGAMIGGAVENVIHGNGTQQLTKENIDTLIQRELDVIISIVSENVEDLIKFVESSVYTQMKQISQVFSHNISTVISMNMMSQVIYYGLPDRFIENNLAANNSTKDRLFKVDSISQLFTAIESRLVEPNNKQSYNLYVILPHQESSQSTYFLDKNGQKSNSISTSYRKDAFFLNKDEDFNLVFKSIMRNLLLLPPIQPENILTRSGFFSKTETDSLIRTMILRQLWKCFISLESITKLVEQVQNIVIMRQIAAKMNDARDLSLSAVELLGKGKLYQAFEASSKAYHLSELAFFDPSLLALLYFPEDQKYAVYLPLFLPVSLPLLTSIYHLIKYFKGSMKKKKD